MAAPNTAPTPKINQLTLGEILERFEGVLSQTHYRVADLRDFLYQFLAYAIDVPQNQLNIRGGIPKALEEYCKDQAPNLMGKFQIGKFEIFIGQKGQPRLQAIKALNIPWRHAISFFITIESGNPVQDARVPELARKLYWKAMSSIYTNMLTLIRAYDDPSLRAVKEVIDSCYECIRVLLVQALDKAVGISSNGNLSPAEQERNDHFMKVVTLCIFELCKRKMKDDDQEFLRALFLQISSITKLMIGDINQQRKYALLRSYMVLFRVFLTFRVTFPQMRFELTDKEPTIVHWNDYTQAVVIMSKINLHEDGVAHPQSLARTKRQETFGEIIMGLHYLINIMKMKSFYFINMEDAYNDYCKLVGIFLRKYDQEMSDLRRKSFRYCKNPPDIIEIPIQFDIQALFDNMTQIIQFIAAANMHAEEPLSLIATTTDSNQPLHMVKLFKEDSDQYSLVFHKYYCTLLTSMLRGAPLRDDDNYEKFCNVIGFGDAEENSAIKISLNRMQLSADTIYATLRYYQEQLETDSGRIIDIEDFSNLAGLVEIAEKCFIAERNSGWYADRSFVILLGSFLPYPNVSSEMKSEIWSAFTQMSKIPAFANQIWSIIREFGIIKSIIDAYKSDPECIQVEELAAFIMTLSSLLEHTSINFEYQREELGSFVTFVLQDLIPKSRFLKRKGAGVESMNWSLLIGCFRLLYYALDKFDEHPSLSFLGQLIGRELDSIHPVISYVKELLDDPCPEYQCTEGHRNVQLSTIVEVSENGFLIEEAICFCLKLVHILFVKGEQIKLKADLSVLNEIVNARIIIDYCLCDFCPMIQVAALQNLSYIQTKKEFRSSILSILDDLTPNPEEGSQSRMFEFQNMVRDIIEIEIEDRASYEFNLKKVWHSRRELSHMSLDKTLILLNIFIGNFMLSERTLSQALFERKHKSGADITNVFQNRYMQIDDLPLEILSVAYHVLYLIISGNPDNITTKRIKETIETYQDDLLETVSKLESYEENADYFAFMNWFIMFSLVVVKDTQNNYSKRFVGILESLDPTDHQDPILLRLYRTILHKMPVNMILEYRPDAYSMPNKEIFSFPYEDYLSMSRDGFSLYDKKAIAYKLSFNIIHQYEHSSLPSEKDSLKIHVESILSSLNETNVNRRCNHFATEAFKSWAKLLNVCLNVYSQFIGHHHVFSQLMYTLVDLLTQALRTYPKWCNETSAAICTLIGRMVHQKSFSDESFCGIFEGLCHALLQIRGPEIHKQSLYYAMILCLRVGQDRAPSKETSHFQSSSEGKPKNVVHLRERLLGIVYSQGSEFLKVIADDCDGPNTGSKRSAITMLSKLILLDSNKGFIQELQQWGCLDRLLSEFSMLCGSDRSVAMHKGSLQSYQLVIDSPSDPKSRELCMLYDALSTFFVDTAMSSSGASILSDLGIIDVFSNSKVLRIDIIGLLSSPVPTEYSEKMKGIDAYYLFCEPIMRLLRALSSVFFNQLITDKLLRFFNIFGHHFMSLCQPSTPCSIHQSFVSILCQLSESPAFYDYMDYSNEDNPLVRFMMQNFASTIEGATGLTSLNLSVLIFFSNCLSNPTSKVSLVFIETIQNKASEIISASTRKLGYSFSELKRLSRQLRAAKGSELVRVKESTMICIYSIEHLSLITMRLIRINTPGMPFKDIQSPQKTLLARLIANNSAFFESTRTKIEARSVGSILHVVLGELTQT